MSFNFSLLIDITEKF